MSTDDRFNIPCPGCGAEIAVARVHIGKKGRCPTCQTVFPILEPAPAMPLEAVTPAALQPLPSWPAAPAATSPFASTGYNQGGGYQTAQDDEMRLAPIAAAPATGDPPMPYQDSLRKAYEAPQHAPTQSSGGDVNGSLVAGLGMMIGAVVWFFAGLFFGVIFIYPPILFIIGLIAFVRGVMNMFSR